MTVMCDCKLHLLLSHYHLGFFINNGALVALRFCSEGGSNPITAKLPLLNPSARPLTLSAPGTLYHGFTLSLASTSWHWMWKVCSHHYIHCLIMDPSKEFMQPMPRVMTSILEFNFYIESLFNYHFYHFLWLWLSIWPFTKCNLLQDVHSSVIILFHYG